jgi:UDP-2,3-diacylglucosamine pyrophosphatase LpxH
MQIPAGKKVYFLSDFHLGVPNHASSLEREKQIVSFLEQSRKDAAMIFVVGDLFDFWFEYRTVVPKGYVRILGKLAELTDSGIPIHFFVGICSKKLPEPALGSITKSHLVQSYFSPSLRIHFSEIFYLILQRDSYSKKFLSNRSI